MGRTRGIAQWVGGRASRRLLRSIPYVGAVVALAYVGQNMRRKGRARGAADSALNAIPYVGAAKTVAETLRGRDFIEDRPRRAGDRAPATRR